MLAPEKAARHFAIEKRRRLQEGIFFYIYEKKRWNPELKLSPEIIRGYVARYKSSLTFKMKHEQQLIKEGVLPAAYKAKPKVIPTDIERALAEHKKLILELTDIPIPTENPNHVYVNARTRID